MKIKHRLFAMLLAVMLCVTAFSMPAFAYADEGCTSETTAAAPAETTVTDTTANSDENAGEDTAKLTPSGNLTLVDDIQTTESTSKQFITLQSKSGNTFYLVIDRSGDKENVYFLNLVDEADLMALIDKDGGTATQVKQTCTCTEKCAAGSVNTDCPVCKNNMSECTGKEKAAETTAETAGSAAAEPSASGQTGNSGKIALVAVLALALVGGAIFYVLKNKKSKPKTKGPTDLDDYDYGDDAGDEEEYENEDEPETPAPQSDTGPEDAEK